MKDLTLQEIGLEKILDSQKQAVVYEPEIQFIVDFHKITEKEYTELVEKNNLPKLSLNFETPKKKETNKKGAK